MENDNKKLIIYGIGKLAEYVQYVFENDSKYEVIGFCIEKSLKEKNRIHNLPLYSLEGLENTFEENLPYLFVAVGNNAVRKRIFTHIKREGFEFARYISRKASTWPNLITGENVFIGEGSIIQPFVKIGDNSLHFGSRIGHHSEIHSHTLLSGTTIGGNTQIGEESYLGMNSAIKQNLVIGKRNIIGMNVSIEKNTTEGAVFAQSSNPPRKISYEQVTKRFLL